MIRIALSLAVLAACVLAASSSARADRRAYVWTYEYLTLAKGDSEVEYYNTPVVQVSGAGIASYTHQVEFEHGILDGWDAGLYQVFTQEPGEGGSLAYGGFKVKTRYRFGERGMLPVDPLVYVEYIQGAGAAEEALEGKIILARDIGKVNIAANYVEEMEWKKTWAEKEWAWEAILAASYELDRAVKIGVEYQREKDEEYIGPTVSLASGNNWCAFGARWGTTADSAAFQTRLIIGIGL